MLNHKITEWLDYCTDLLKLLVLHSCFSDWVTTFAVQDLSSFCFMCQLGNSVKVHFYDQCFTSKNLLSVFILWTPTFMPNHAGEQTWCFILCAFWSVNYRVKEFIQTSDNGEPSPGKGDLFLPPLYSPWALQHTHLSH